MVGAQHPFAKLISPGTPRLKPAAAEIVSSPVPPLQEVSRSSRVLAPSVPAAVPVPVISMPCPPGCYRPGDARVIWVNNRPYLLNRLLGKGGFGEVHEVEMLLPCGLEVDWDDSGNVRFDEDGYIMLNKRNDRDHVDALSSSTSSEDPGDEQECPASEAVKCESSQLPFELSMTPSECMWFSLVGREEAAEDGGRTTGSRPALPSTPAPRDRPTQRLGDVRRSVAGSRVGGDRSPVHKVETDSVPHGRADADAKKKKNCDFPMVSDSILQGSSVFFALKLQSARDEKQLDSLVKEVQNMRALSGDPGIVQLREHAVNKKSLYLVIVMELGACDLHEFLKRSQYTLGLHSICSLWQTLVHRVESLHKSDIIHRDIKAQNFILVPTKGYRGAEILASASTRRNDFVFRLVQSDRQELSSGKQGDVELTITDSVTGKEEVLLLTIKLTDFGIARTLDPDESHLSLEGPNGTVVFMAPEAVRQTVSGCRKVSKRVDIWALGVMLYQMLHEGQTPFGHYLTKGGPPEVLLAIASETVNRKAMDFDASSMWEAERTRLFRASESSETDHPGDPSQDLLPRTTTAEMVQALVISWVGSEFLVRVCKRCLTFDVDDRIDGADLRVWIDRAIETGWGALPGAAGGGGICPKSELLQAAFNIDSTGKMMQTVDIEVSRIGERVGASLFPEIWMNSRQTPAAPSPSPHMIEGGSSSAPGSSVRIINDREFLDLEAGRVQGRFRQALPWIVVILLSVGGLCAIGGIVFACCRSSYSPGNNIEDDGGGFSSVPSSTSVSPVPSPEQTSSSSSPTIVIEPGGVGVAVGGNGGGTTGEIVGRPGPGGTAGGGDITGGGSGTAGGGGTACGGGMAGGGGAAGGSGAVGSGGSPGGSGARATEVGEDAGGSGAAGSGESVSGGGAGARVELGLGVGVEPGDNFAPILDLVGPGFSLETPRDVLLKVLDDRLPNRAAMRHRSIVFQRDIRDPNHNAEIIAALLGHLTQLHGENVRSVAVRVVGKLAESGNSAVVAAMFGLLRDDHESNRVRAEAISVLVGVAEQENLHQVIEVVLDLLRNAEGAYYHSAVQNLVRLAADDNKGPQQKVILISAVLDRFGAEDGWLFDEEAVQVLVDIVRFWTYGESSIDESSIPWPWNSWISTKIVEALSGLTNVNRQIRTKAAKELQLELLARYETVCGRGGIAGGGGAGGGSWAGGGDGAACGGGIVAGGCGAASGNGAAGSDGT